MALEDYFNDNPFIEALKPPEIAKSTGARRLASLAVKGASLGLLGAKHPAEGFVEGATEFVGSIPTIVGVSAIASPGAAAGLKLARLPVTPTLARLVGAGATGATIGAVEGVVKGENPLISAGTTAAGFIAGESLFLGGAKALAAIRGKTVAKAIEETVTTSVPDLPPTVPFTQKALPPGPPGPLALPPGPGAPKQLPVWSETTLSRGPFPMPPSGLLPDPPFGSLIDDPISAAAGGNRPILRVTDEGTGVIMHLPTTPEADAAIKAVGIAPFPYRTKAPFTMDQNYYMTERPYVTEYDTVSAKLPKTTSELLKKTPEEVDKIITEGDGLFMADVVVIDKTPEGKTLGAILSDIKVSLDDSVTISEVAKGARAKAPEGPRTLAKVRKKKPGPITEEGKPYRPSDQYVKPEDIGKPGAKKAVSPIERPKPGESEDVVGLVDDPLHPGEKIWFAAPKEMSDAERQAWIQKELAIRCKRGAV